MRNPTGEERGRGNDARGRLHLRLPQPPAFKVILGVEIYSRRGFRALKMPPKHGKKKINPRTDSRCDLVGKFKTSVKRFVQEVEIDNTREGAVQTNERLRLVAGKVSVSYNTVKGALTGLHERYESSKAERNVFRRYALLKGIVKEVIQLDAQYWLLLDVPKQDKQEQVNAYVLRACAVLEKASDTRPQGEASKSQAAQQAEEEAREKERKARLEASTVQQIEEENTLLINDLYRLLKKYANLKQVVHTLHLSYRGARMYPIFPRYNMLKDMIKDVLRDPSYMEVCHEES